MPNVSPLRLHHVGTSVPDLDATVAWYRDVLGFAPDYTYTIAEPPARVAFLRLGECRLELFAVAGSAPLPPTATDLGAGLREQGLKHFALATDDLDASMRALAARGVAFVTPVTPVPDSGGERWAFFRDCNGLLIELYESVRP